MCKLIPAIDLLDGKCVRLQQGSFDNVTPYQISPIDYALELRDLGIEYLHLVDLDGARSGYPVNLSVLERLVAISGLKIDFGGGVRSIESIRRLLQIGADRINIGTFAINNQQEILTELSKDEIKQLILALDFKGRTLKINGWLEDSASDLSQLIGTYVRQGLKTLCSTQVNNDGMLSGPDLALYRELRQSFPTCEIIASGGIRNLQDLEDLNQIPIEGAIIGKSLLDGEITKVEIRSYQEVERCYANV